MSPPALPARMQQGTSSPHELSPYDAGAESQISSISFQPQKELAESAGSLYHPLKITNRPTDPLQPRPGRTDPAARRGNRGSVPSAASLRAQLRWAGEGQHTQQRARAAGAGHGWGSIHSKEHGQLGPGTAGAAERGAR